MSQPSNRNNFTPILKYIFLCFCGLLLTTCTQSGASPTLKIGLVAPFEGLHRSLGYEMLFAVKLAVQAQNQAGGLAGIQVELVALNDFNDPAEAEQQAKALVADPAVVGVVGHLASAPTMAALPLYQAADLAVVVPWSLATLPPENQTGVVMVAADQAEIVARLEAIAQEQGLAPLQPLAMVDTDLDDLHSITPLLLTDGVMAGEIILQLNQAGRSGPIFGGPEAGCPHLIDVAGHQADGFIFASPGPDPAHIAATDFVTAYQALAGGAPGPRAVLAYDATQVLLTAIEAAIRDSDGLLSRAEVRAKINLVQHLGLSGNLAFDEQGYRLERPLWIYQITEGAYPGRLIAP